MYRYQIHDPFFWKDQISVDVKHWSDQRERIDRLELIAFLEFAILMALAFVLSTIAINPYGFFDLDTGIRNVHYVNHNGRYVNRGVERVINEAMKRKLPAKWDWIKESNAGLKL
ncbi:MAG TPA: hypothetical protein V6D17_16140 [Candidatus Obscuribacterales bacterium]